MKAKSQLRAVIGHETAKWEARGEERKAISIAQNLVNLGLPPETVVSATKLDPEKVKALYQNSSNS